MHHACRGVRGVQQLRMPQRAAPAGRRALQVAAVAVGDKLPDTKFR